MNLGGLKQELAAQRAILSISEAGKLKYDAPGPLPVALVEAMKEHKAALLEELTAAQPTRPARRPEWPAPELLDLAQQPGHCGGCARWEAIPERSHMGLCSAGRRSCGYLDGAPFAPVEISAVHGCIVYGGKGWRAAPGMTLTDARGTGERNDAT